MAAPLTVRDVMTPDPMTLPPGESLMEALQMMRLRKVRRIPIVDGGRLVGIITEGDLKRAEPSTLTDTEEHFIEVMEATKVEQIMVRNLVTTTPGAPLVEAARTLRTNKYGALPVLEGEKLIGILTDNDLIAALVRLLDLQATGEGPGNKS